MCGRYVGFDDGNDVIKEIYRQTAERYPDAPVKMGEVFPTETVPVLAGPHTRPVPMKWGYPGFRGKGIIINARAETVTERETFRDSFLRARCVVPTCGYYEWDKQKTKFRFNLPDTPVLWLGGFYGRFEDGRRFVILTTAPNDSVRDVHDRMPLILTDEMKQLWTTDTAAALRYLTDPMPALIRREA